jgi:allantoin racemase
LKIFILSPILETTDDERKRLRSLSLEGMTRRLPPNVELEQEGVERGAATIESYYDEYVGLRDMAEKAVDAQRRGFDAVVINCFMNPGLEGLRELLDIPVVGAGEAALYAASMLGDNFAILDPDPPHRTYSHRVVASLGLSHKLNSVMYMSLGVAGLSEDFDSVLGSMTELAEMAVKEKGAHVVVFGCTGMMRYAERLSERMKKHGVPVVEPLTTAIAIAETFARLGLRQSKLSYPKPSEKRRK